MTKQEIIDEKLGNREKDFFGDSYGNLFDAMEEWAEQVAKERSITFAEWINKEGWKEYDGADRWICPTQDNTVLETKQLYEKFLQSTNK